MKGSTLPLTQVWGRKGVTYKRLRTKEEGSRGLGCQPTFQHLNSPCSMYHSAVSREWAGTGTTHDTWMRMLVFGKKAWDSPQNQIERGHYSLPSWPPSTRDP